MSEVKPNFLPESTWLGVIKHAPLVAIDLIITDYDHRVLLGKRLNAPAKGYWFTPGSAIRKNETLQSAFKRCLNEELGAGTNHRREDFPVTIYEHIYPDNFKGLDFGTHYVVLAHRISHDELINLDLESHSQHSDYKWWDLDDLMDSPEVHENVKDYFRRF